MKTLILNSTQSSRTEKTPVGYNELKNEDNLN